MRIPSRKHPNEWQRHAALALHTAFREHVVLQLLLPVLNKCFDPGRACMLAHGWLAYRSMSRQLWRVASCTWRYGAAYSCRLPLPIMQARCGGDGRHGCCGRIAVLGDHSTRCPRTSLLARCSFVLAREQVGQKAGLSPHHCTRCGAGGPPSSRLGRVWHQAERRRPLLCQQRFWPEVQNPPRRQFHCAEPLGCRYQLG